FLSC
ncbi:hypothetical protein VCHC69A1_1336B, partial [Vibrio cholerae HC-69A1]